MQMRKCCQIYFLLFLAVASNQVLSQEVCSKFDLIWIYDVSVSVDSRELALERAFINQFSEGDFVKWGQNDSRSGLVAMSGLAGYYYFLVGEQNAAFFAFRLTQILGAFGPVRTNIGAAMRAAKRGIQFQAREFVPNVVVLLTDGYHNVENVTGPQVHAEEIRQDLGGIIIAVSIGDDTNQTELEQITGNRSLIFNSSTFSELSTLLPTITQQVCNAPPARTVNVHCSAMFTFGDFQVDLFNMTGIKMYDDMPTPTLKNTPECGMQLDARETVDIPYDMTEMTIKQKSLQSGSWNAHTVTVSQFPVPILGFRLTSSNFEFKSADQNFSTSFDGSSVTVNIPEVRQMFNDEEFTAEFEIVLGENLNSTRNF